MAAVFPSTSTTTWLTPALEQLEESKRSVITTEKYSPVVPREFASLFRALCARGGDTTFCYIVNYQGVVEKVASAIRRELPECSSDLKVVRYGEDLATVDSQVHLVTFPHPRAIAQFCRTASRPVVVVVDDTYSSPVTMDATLSIIRSLQEAFPVTLAVFSSSDRSGARAHGMGLRAPISLPWNGKHEELPRLKDTLDAPWQYHETAVLGFRAAGLAPDASLSLVPVTQHQLDECEQRLRLLGCFERNTHTPTDLAHDLAIAPLPPRIGLLLSEMATQDTGMFGVLVAYVLKSPPDVFFFGDLMRNPDDRIARCTRSDVLALAAGVAVELRDPRVLLGNRYLSRLLEVLPRLAGFVGIEAVVPEIPIDLQSSKVAVLRTLVDHLHIRREERFYQPLFFPEQPVRKLFKGSSATGSEFVVGLPFGRSKAVNGVEYEPRLKLATGLSLDELRGVPDVDVKVGRFFKSKDRWCRSTFVRLGDRRAQIFQTKASVGDAPTWKPYFITETPDSIFIGRQMFQIDRKRLPGKVIMMADRSQLNDDVLTTLSMAKGNILISGEEVLLQVSDGSNTRSFANLKTWQQLRKRKMVVS